MNSFAPKKEDNSRQNKSEIKLKYFQLEEREVVEGWQMDRQTDIISYKAVSLLMYNTLLETEK